MPRCKHEYDIIRVERTKIRGMVKVWRKCRYCGYEPKPKEETEK